jgi:hypothetical protein
LKLVVLQPERLLELVVLAQVLLERVQVLQQQEVRRQRERRQVLVQQQVRQVV